MSPNPRFPLHQEASADIGADIDQVFAYVDDPRHLAGHMETSSPMMAGSSMQIEVDERGGRGMGAHIRMTGRALGFPLSLDEAVVVYEPPRHKAWETLGEPRLLILGGYRMGVDLQPLTGMTRLRVWIDYAWPAGGVPRLLGRLLAASYARWCTKQMLRSCRDRFKPVAIKLITT
jgi:hypothetical protein